jgi:sulfate-transporting ATPase
VEGVRVRYGGVVAVDGLSFTVSAGEVVGLIGPNGAGKTTMVDAISGLVRVDSGTICIDDRSIHNVPTHRRASRGVARTFQSVELFDSLSVLDNLRVGSEQGGMWSFVRDTVAPRKARLSAAARAAIAEFGLTGILSKMPADLSFGERRLVGIARGMASGTSILLLDEPAAGLDDLQCEELGDLIRRLADQWGMSVLLVEHHVPLVERICDRIVAMSEGRPIAAGTPAEVMASPAVHQSYLGVAVDLQQDGPREVDNAAAN